VEIQQNLTWAATTERPTHSHISKFDLTKSLKSSNLPDGSAGKSWRFWELSNTLSGHKIADIRKKSQSIKVHSWASYLFPVAIQKYIHSDCAFHYNKHKYDGHVLRVGLRKKRPNITVRSHCTKHYRTQKNVTAIWGLHSHSQFSSFWVLASYVQIII